MEKEGFFVRNKNLVAASTLVGTIVGAGVLGIPYVVSQVGIIYGFVVILLLGLAFLMLNLFGGEIILRTKGQHQLTGYAEKYLGKNGKRFMMLALMISIYGALTAYLMGVGNTLDSMIPFGSAIFYSIVFFAITFFIIYKGVKATGKAELVLIFLLLLVVALIGVLSFDSISITNFASSNPPKFFSIVKDFFSGQLTHSFSQIYHSFFQNIAIFFLPYGVILFAYMGMPAIPEMQEQLGKNKKQLKKAIIIGSVAPIILYLVFTFIIVGVVGADGFATLEPNQRIATIALSLYTSPILGFFANILAILAMFTSFLTLGIALTQAYQYDYKLSKNFAFALTFIIPLGIVLLNLTSFITVLGVTGALAGGLESTLLILIYWKAKTLGDRKPEYTMPRLTWLGVLLILMFALGVIYQFISF